MKIKRIEVTPAQACAWLSEKNVNNRVWRQKHVDFLASEMVGGRWVETPQGIAFAVDGRLIDGQHRLGALIQANMTIPFWVAFDCVPEAQDVMDCQIIRTVPDQLQLGGLANSKLKVAAVRQIVSLCTNFQNYKIGVQFTRGVLLEFERDIEFVMDALVQFKPSRRGFVIGALAFAVSADRRARDFVQSFGSGENLRKGNPAKTARDWLTNGNSSCLRQSYKAPAVEILMNAAFNAVTGADITQAKSGARGLQFFMGKKRRFVETIREQMIQQMASTPAALKEVPNESVKLAAG